MAYEIKYRSDNEMKDSGIEWLGKIPKEWSGCKIKHIATLKIGNSISALDKENKYSKVIDNFYPYIATKDINVDIKTIEHGNNLFIPRNTNFEVAKRGTSLICIEGGSAGRKIGYLKEDSCFGNKLCNVEANKKVINRLLYYILQTDHFGVEFFNKTTGIIPGVSIEEFKTINTVLPNGEDQQKIANFLDIKIAEFDSIISKKELLIEKLEEAKKSLISEVVTGKVKIVDGELVEREPEEMKDSGVEWLGMIPKDWEVKRLKYLFTFKNGINADANKYGTGIKFINVKEVIDNDVLLYEDIPNRVSISKSQFIENRVIKGDILLNRTSETREEIGFSTVYIDTKDVVFGGFVIRGREIGRKVTDGLKRYLLSSHEVRRQMILFSSGSIRKNISQSNLKDIYVVLPDIGEQNHICDMLKERITVINSIITKTQKQIIKLKEAKQSLISEAVTGKIDLRDWEIIETGGR